MTDEERKAAVLAEVRKYIDVPTDDEDKVFNSVKALVKMVNEERQKKDDKN
jgi:hypothetical protein